MSQAFFLFDDLKEEIKRREISAAKQTNKEEIVLRPYQSDSVDGVYEQWKSCRTTLVCLPTGTGKSVVFSEVMRRWSDQ